MPGISVLLSSLPIIPLATALPEKGNGILWIRRGNMTDSESNGRTVIW